MRKTPGSGGRLSGKFTLDELDDLLGYVAAEANHTKSKKLEKEFDGPFAAADAPLTGCGKTLLESFAVLRACPELDEGTNGEELNH